MGYLPHTGGLSKTPHLIVVDAVLTEMGRFRLAEGAGNFNITKFALGDDEIDYSLYDTSQPTENQDDVIMLTPVLEAVPDATVGIRHFLYTAPAPDDGFSKVPTMTATPEVMDIQKGNDAVITVTTNNAADPDMLYTVTFTDNNATEAFDITGDTIKSSPMMDDIVKTWVMNATGDGNNVGVRIAAKTLSRNPDTKGVLQDGDRFTYTVQIRGTTTGLLKTVTVTWFDVRQQL